jgi:hypothetical protein
VTPTARTDASGVVAAELGVAGDAFTSSLSLHGGIPNGRVLLIGGGWTADHYK